MKRFLVLLGLLCAAAASQAASYTVDSVGFLVDSNGRRVGYKRPNGAEDYFLTLNAAMTGLVLPDGTTFTVAGSGTVTATAGNLTLNSVVLGAGTVDSKVVAGITSDGTSIFTLGVAGTSVGGIDFKNATSGTLSLRPATGALGTVTLTLPASTATLATTTQALAESICVAASDETTALTTGTAKVTFRMPYALTGVTVRGSLATAQTSGSILTVDVNEAGTTILSTKLTIDNAERTSTTAATAAVVSDSSLADDAEITIDIDQVGDGTAKGLKVCISGSR
jgi:hypothetical protein